jgi:hypothetical protein
VTSDFEVAPILSFPAITHASLGNGLADKSSFIAS